MSRNRHLDRAKKTKNDEFYTLAKDVKEMLDNLTAEMTKNKIILCPADDYRRSEFVKYLRENFTRLGIKELWAYWIDTQNTIFTGYLWKYNGKNEYVTEVGYFDIPPVFDECDIIITNPPFSKIRFLFESLAKKQKKFILLAPFHFIGYDVWHKYLKNNKLYYYGFKGYYFSGANKSVTCVWINNLGIEKLKKMPKNTQELKDFVYLDNTKILYVETIKNLPKNYDGLMAVPLTFVFYDISKNYTILGEAAKYVKENNILNKTKITLNGKEIFLRIIVKKNN